MKTKTPTKIKCSFSGCERTNYQFYSSKIGLLALCESHAELIERYKDKIEFGEPLKRKSSNRLLTCEEWDLLFNNGEPLTKEIKKRLG